MTEGLFMIRTLLVLLAAFTAAATADAAEPSPQLSIRSGEAVVLRIDGGGAVTVLSRGKAPAMVPFEQRGLGQLAQIPVPPGTKTMPGVPMKDAEAAATPVAPGEIRVTLRDVAGKTAHDALLVIENGYERGLVYRAVMRRGDKAAPTDVCLVMPHKRGFEHWPFRLDRLDLTDLRLVPWKPEDGLPCE
jgi:hypothetical protein